MLQQRPVSSAAARAEVFQSSMKTYNRGHLDTAAVKASNYTV